MTVFVFSGTSEGRELIEKLNKEKIFCHAFVATEYGEAVMKSHPLCQVHRGRLNLEEIEQEIKMLSPDYIFDATHPHAIEISVNIKQACENLEQVNRYVRISRPIEKISKTGGNTLIEPITQTGRESQIESESQTGQKPLTEAISHMGNNHMIVESFEKAAQLLASFHYSDKGTILLTTGVKELAIFAREEKIKERLIVRILPGIESLEKAKEMDIPSKHIVAMEGPFGRELNLALINHFQAEILVTKNSGSRGGYYDKLEAASIANIPVIIIDQKTTEEGISIEEAVKWCHLGE